MRNTIHEDVFTPKHHSVMHRLTSSSVEERKSLRLENVVDYPAALDVMCGIGHEKDHSGNKLLKHIIAQYGDQYARAQTKKAKIALSRKILTRLGELGIRFLKKSNTTQFWHVASPKVARDKIGHFLRLQLRKGPPKHTTIAAKALQAAVMASQEVAPFLPRSSSPSSSLPTTPLERSRNALRSLAAKAELEGNMKECRILSNVLVKAGDTSVSQIKQELGFSNLQDHQSLEQQTTSYRPASYLSSALIERQYGSNETSAELSKTMLFPDEKSDSFEISTTLGPTNAGAQPTFEEMCETSDFEKWLNTYSQETPSKMPSKMPFHDKQQAARKRSSIDDAAGTATLEWERLLLLASYNSKKAGIKAFALDDDDIAYNALELFDKSDLAVRLD